MPSSENLYLSLVDRHEDIQKPFLEVVMSLMVLLNQSNEDVARHFKGLATEAKVGVMDDFYLDTCLCHFHCLL